MGIVSLVASFPTSKDRILRYPTALAVCSVAGTSWAPPVEVQAGNAQGTGGNVASSRGRGSNTPISPGSIRLSSVSLSLAPKAADADVFQFPVHPAVGNGEARGCHAVGYTGAVTTAFQVAGVISSSLSRRSKRETQPAWSSSMHSACGSPGWILHSMTYGYHVPAARTGGAGPGFHYISSRPLNNLGPQPVPVLCRELQVNVNHIRPHEAPGPAGAIEYGRGGLAEPANTQCRSRTWACGSHFTLQQSDCADTLAFRCSTDLAVVTPTASLLSSHLLFSTDVRPCPVPKRALPIPDTCVVKQDSQDQVMSACVLLVYGIFRNGACSQYSMDGSVSRLPVPRHCVNLSYRQVLNILLHVIGHGGKWRGHPARLGYGHTIYADASLVQERDTGSGLRGRILRMAPGCPKPVPKPSAHSTADNPQMHLGTAGVRLPSPAIPRQDARGGQAWVSHTPSMQGNAPVYYEGHEACFLDP